MRIYFDYASSTPVDPEVIRAMSPYFAKQFGNPGSLHSFGQEAQAAIDRSREVLTRSLGAEFREIVFTGSATEANNLALRGVLRAFLSGRASGACGNLRPRIIVSSIEHESILRTARDLEKEGVETVSVPVGKEGVIDLGVLERALRAETILVSVMFANNEIGTIQPIAEISDMLCRFREKNSSGLFPLFHTDAVQAFQFLDCNVKDLGVDLLTLSAHKIYGPKGIGMLYIKKGGMAEKKEGSYAFISPVITGGGQEFNFRSGTENVPFMCGFAKAVELASSLRISESKRIRALKDHFWKKLKMAYPSIGVNGPLDSRSLPNIINVYFPKYSAEELLMKFDLRGMAVSSGSACAARSPGPSHVLAALGVSAERAKSSIRFSFGKATTKHEIDSALRIITMSLGMSK